MKTIKICLIGLLCLSQSLFANDKVSGIVLDAENKPISNVKIITNTNITTTTNNKGEFTLDCDRSESITVSHEQFSLLKLKIECNESLSIVMHRNSKDLDTLRVYSDYEDAIVSQSTVRLNRTELKRNTGLFLDDAINANVPGVYMERRSISGGQKLTIRGYNNGMGPRGVNSNFDIQGVKLYLNNIPVTDAEGLTVMDDIDFSSVNSMSVIKGPSSSIHGFSISGVMILNTNSNFEEGYNFSQDISGGSYGLFRSTSNISISDKNHSIKLNYGKQKYDGFMPHTNSDKDFVNLIYNSKLDDKQNISALFSYIDSYDQRNGELTKEQYEKLDYSGNPNYIKNDAHSSVLTTRFGISHDYQFNINHKLSTTLFGTSQNIDQSSAGGWTDKLPINYGFRSTFETKYNYGNEILISGIVGVEFQSMKAQLMSYSMAPDSTNLSGYNIINSTRSNQATNNQTNSIFTQWNLSLPMQFEVGFGVGISSLSMELSDKLWATSNNHPNNIKQKTYSNDYSNLINPSLSLSKSFGNELKVYSSFSIGYKPPVSSNILITTTGQLNDNLKVEKATQIELGLKGVLFKGRLSYNATFFNLNYNDKFTFITVQNPDNNTTLYSYLQNAGEMKNNGFEFLTKYDILKNEYSFNNFSIFTNITYSDFKYGDFKLERIGKDENNKDIKIVDDYTGKEVAGVSPLISNMGIDLELNNGIYGNLVFSHKSPMYYTSDGLNKTKSYNVVNAKIGFKFNYDKIFFDFYFNGINLNGVQYYQMVFVNQLPDAYIPAPNELNYFGGINIKYQL